jgi:hypothetical protein
MENRPIMADIVYRGIIDVLKARRRPVCHRRAFFRNLDSRHLGFERSPDFILIQVASAVGNVPTTKFAFY